MANIKIPKKQFEKDFGKLDEKMQHQIAMLGTPLEGFDDNEIELEIFPNRPDMLSYQGFKRALSSFLGKTSGLTKYKVNPPQKNFEVKIDSSIKNIRPFTACAIVKNIELDNEKIKEIIEIQEKIHNTIGRKRKKLAIGIYPLEKITLPITYRALEPDKIKFLPLESEREMSGLEILQRHPTGKEYAHLLAGKAKFPIFIDANKEILSMPPIINSQLTGKITEQTKDVFIECSGFDFEILKKCLNIISTTLAEMGGTIYQMDILYDKKERTPNLTTEKIKISLENTNKLLGLKIKESQLKSLLEKMGYNYNKGRVEIPMWRTDILHEVDIIEDVAIAYGYDNFIPELPRISTIGEEDKKERLKRKIAEIFSGLGLLEVSNYNLTTMKDQFTNMGIAGKKETGFIEILNSKTDYTILRKDLSHYLLKILSENVDAEYPQKIYETGKIYGNGETIVEKESLAGAIAPGNFTEIKQILENLGRAIDIKLSFEEPKQTPTQFIEGRTASIKIDAREIGFIGEIHPRILKNWKIKMPVALFELNLEEIYKKLSFQN
ncbi:MAG: phenylalanine--tRNA ligase subunit beta [Nanoarchaeota archaeon]|nr:phenylalanine--tRNA ligase subunit beta [Nanoarchaeota archaeon]